MKRFWLVLLSLGLIVAFSTSAMAVDVKFSGEYYAAGLYLDKTTLNKDPIALRNNDVSTAFYFQRLRLGTQFVVSPGLSVITRADIMERAWGAARSAPGAGGFLANDIQSAGTRAENENIAFDWAYLSYTSPIGLFNLGYMDDGCWATIFGNSSLPVGKLTYTLPIGSFIFGLQTGKPVDGERSAGVVGGTISAADRDNSFYTALGIYNWKGGNAGLLLKYVRSASSRNLLGALVASGDYGWETKQYIAVPYVKAQLGPVALQAEFTYVTGKAQKFEGTATAAEIAALAAFGAKAADVDLNAYSGWIDATADFGMFYAGGTFAFASGDDLGTADKQEGGLSGGLDWNPCLIMFNSDLNYWAGNINGYGATAMSGLMTNAYFLQARGGIRPIQKLDISLSYSWAKAEKSGGVGFDNREYGSEIDLTATYKLTNNLSYMMGAGYWMVGDYYKSNVLVNNELQNELMVLNKLTLTF
jgi:hypothetical protein